jgi:anaerobic magnesium-protoporphyrin IX monomethyl ester cyclase
MKVVLINPPLTSEQRLYKELSAVKINYPPLGLCFLASVLRKTRFDVKILDLQIYEESIKNQAQRVLREKPDFIGITAVSIAIKNAAKLALEIKKKTKVPIILGGPHITAVPNKTMELFPQFDIGVIGEGEETVPKLLLALEKNKNLEEVSGLVFRQPSTDNRQLTTKLKLTPPRQPIQNLDTLPLPAFELLPDFSHYGGSQFIEFDARPTFRLITSRGCPFNCRFCDKSVFGKIFRAHSSSYVLKMIKILYEGYGIKHIYFSDDTFTLDKKRIFKLCKLLKEESLDLTWDCNTRVDTVDLSLLKEMKKAGCTYIAYGIESGSQKILNILNKQITLEQIRKACEETVKAGIKIRGNFMIGNPGETKETIEKTIKFAKNLPLHTFKMSFFTPFPNTEIYEEIDKWGKYKEDWSKLSKYSPVFIPKGLTQEDLEKYYRRAYFSFYFRPKVIFNYLFQLKNLTALKYAFANFLILFRFLLAKKLKKYRRLVTFLVSLLIFVLLFSRIEIGETLAAFLLTDFRFLILACLLSILTNFFWITDKWKRILRILGYSLFYRDLLFARVGSYAVRGVLPLKSGEVSRIAYLKKFYKVPLKTGVASVVITLVLNILALLIFIVWGILT